MMNLSLEQELARLAARYGTEALLAGAERVALPDFSRAMESVLLELVEYKEPVWRNETTGNMASSVFAAFEALGFTTSKHWSVVAKEALVGPRKRWLTRRMPKGDPPATGVARSRNACQGVAL